MNLKLSVCVPTYESPILFQRALDSILAQVGVHIEIVVSDDSETDSIEKIVKASSREIVYSRNRPALKAPANWNKAIEMASGDVIHLLHHDDYYFSSYSASRVLKNFENSSVDIVFSQCVWDSKKSVNQFVRGAQPEQIEILRNGKLADLFECNFLSVPSVCFFRRTMKTRYDVGFLWLSDVDFYMSAIRENPKAVDGHFAPEVGVNVDDPDQITNSITLPKQRRLEWDKFFAKWRELSSEINLEGADRLSKALAREGLA